MKLIDIPFFDWLFPRDTLPSEEEHLVRQQRSKAKALSSKKSLSESLSYAGSSTRASAESDWTKMGSWIIQHDDYGAPYWVNDVTGETTCGLYIQQTGKGTPITHNVENRHPYHLNSPTTSTPSTTTAAATSSCPSTTDEISSVDGSGSKLSSTGALEGGDDNKSDETMTTNKVKGCIYCRHGGFWEEKYDKVTGAKVWFHTGTRRTTKKDPFF